MNRLTGARMAVTETFSREALNGKTVQQCSVEKYIFCDPTKQLFPKKLSEGDVGLMHIYPPEGKAAD